MSVVLNLADTLVSYASLNSSSHMKNMEDLTSATQGVKSYSASPPANGQLGKNNTIYTNQ